MNIKKILLFIVVILCIIIYSSSAIKISRGLSFGVAVDLSRPLSIIWPCEVAVIGDNGEKGLRIGPKVGRGWRGEAGGEAAYRFFIPQDGKYHIWAYCLWFDECANAIFAKLDDLDKAIIGNDPIYKKWHWVKGFEASLKKGTHSLILSNHSDHIAVQKILLSSSASQSPELEGPVFSDIFYEGFDGCDRGNFTSWKVICGQWEVQNPQSGVCLIENSLIGFSEEQSFIIYDKNENWSDYSFNVAVQSLPSSSPDSCIGICFGLKNTECYYQLKIQPSTDGNKVSAAILKESQNQAINLAVFSLPWRQNAWHQVQIKLSNGSLEVKIDDSEPVKIESREKITGGIGLLLKGKIKAYFDDIHIRTVSQTNRNNRE